MRELGLEVDGDPALGHDLTVYLSAGVQTVSRLARGRASLWVIADGQLLEQIESAEVIEAPDRLADALSRDLVERLARSPRPAQYADALYGRRLRPLRDSVGRHAAGRGDETAGVPPLEMLNYSTTARFRPGTTASARAALPPPPAAGEPARAAAQAAMQTGQALLAAGQAREAYAAFEQAYLLDGSAEPLFGMAESLLHAGAKQQALIFYRAYLRRAPPNSPEAAKATAEISALEPAPRTP
jgi:tetratricopeptide (TPR) repeat protein